MANPLSTGSGRSHAQPGEALTVHDPKCGRSWTVLRSAREFVYDLADAYNAGMEPAARQRGCQWQVGHNGELKLGYSDESTRENRRQTMARLETERTRYIRHMLEQSDPRP